MSSFSLRLMMILMFAALVLNVMNFLFVRVFNSAHQNPYKVVSTTTYKKIWSAVVIRDNTNTLCSKNCRLSNNVKSNSTTPSAFINILMPRKQKTTDEKEMENCPEMPPGLGPELEDRSMFKNFNYSMKAKMDYVKTGGIYQPTNCKALQSVAIIIAYRGCKSHLNTFIDSLHTLLMKQQMDYQIFVVEQTNRTQPFNRGKILNVGFTVATQYRKDGFRCIIFHEPYIVPMDSRNLYRCSWNPRQLVALVERPVKALYLPLLGGVLAVTPQQFLKFNGFSNAYWGNDADYYDLYNRINASNYNLESSLPDVGKYKTIRKGLRLWTRSDFLTTLSPLYLSDGLTSLSYTVDSLVMRRLFTYLEVNIDVVVETKKKAKMHDKLLNSTFSTQRTNQNTINNIFSTQQTNQNTINK